MGYEDKLEAEDVQVLKGGGKGINDSDSTTTFPSNFLNSYHTVFNMLFQ